MPRTINIPSTEYQPGTYGPFTVNGFNSNNTDRLRITFTRENWPGTNEDDVLAASMIWNSGGGTAFTLPGGVLLDKNGVEMLVSYVQVSVPETAATNGKKPVNSAVATMIVNQTLRTAITIEAI